jgi:hypothetical protein
VPVFYQNMAQIGQLGRLAAPLAIQPSFGVSRRGVHLVAPLLGAEITFAIAARWRRLAAAILRPKPLHAGPRLISVPSTEK